MSVRVAHVITGLEVGGAEGMLVRLLGEHRGGATDPVVVTLLPGGALAGEVRALGVPLFSANMGGGVRAPRGFATLVSLLRRLRPAVVQTWLYHADLVGAVAARLAGSPPVAWNLRHSNLHPSLNSRSTLRSARLCAVLSSRLPARIVCGSHAAREAHAAFGYDASRMTVIPNGFDTARHRPDPRARAELRASLGIAAGAPVLGVIGRFHPQKDHRTFVAAAARVAEAFPAARFVLCGRGLEPSNRELAGWIGETGSAARFHLLGERDDVPRVMAALDVMVSSSAGEGFPNAVGEAMACGVPCVVTDVGDSARLVGGTGIVVPASDPAALAAGCVRLLELTAEERRAAGLRARARIEGTYSLSAVAATYEALYLELAGARGPAGDPRLRPAPVAAASTAEAHLPGIR